MRSLSDPPVAASLPSPEMRARVEDELRRILASPAFSGSKRCSDFLEFIVTRTLDGRTDELKERTIAIEVFERDLQYDPKADGVVRVKANEVRKRLAQYYQSASPAPAIRIQLPAGSYVPLIQTGGELPAPARPLPWRWILPLGSALLLAAALLLWPPAPAVSSDLANFWLPLTRSDHPVLIGIITSPVARLTDLSVLAKRLPGVIDRRRYEFPIDDSFRFSGRIVYEVDGQLAVGDALAASSITHCLGTLGKPALVRAGQEVSYLDLRNSPSVLIGAFNNRWGLELIQGLRFQFERTSKIRDTQTGQAFELREDSGRIVEDYALITRLLSSKTGGPVVALGGLRHSGTQAAGDLVSDPDLVRQLAGRLPSGWQNRNLQIVVKTTLLQERPSRPVIVAHHVW